MGSVITCRLGGLDPFWGWDHCIFKMTEGGGGGQS